jgi:glycosyltransferase involved in cell wall biosynthesis
MGNDGPGFDPPLVSIGIPVRNGAAHLAEALESVVAQDYPNLEVIVCDNHSDDDTAAIALRYATLDPRFRYVDNGADLGFLANFKKTLELSNGAYFTWLAHDDLLLHPSYVGTMVAYLQAHREVAACLTAFQLSAFELAGAPEIKAFPEMAPDRWPASRRELFRWPHGWVDLAIYGMFRREELARVPIRNHLYRGRPHIFWWETDLLTELSAAGRIVALPECMRFYRRSTVSAGTRVVSEVSTFDLLRLGWRIKSILLTRALRLPVPLRERVPVIATALANLPRANLRQPYDHRREVRILEREAAALESVAADRSRLIGLLTTVVAERSREAAERGLGAPPPQDGIPPLPPPVEPAARHRLPGAIRSFFTPPGQDEIAYYSELSRRVAALRQACGQLVGVIEALHQKAASLLAILEPPGAGEPARAPLVSVGMPVFNGGEYLEAALRSVLAQDHPNFEVVVVDNASDDETAAIARRFAGEYSRVRYIRNESNIGFLPNFRRALELSSGEYFTWLAHDDELTDPSYLTTTTTFLDRHPDVLCCHTAFHLLDNELPGSRELMRFPELDPGRRWPAARRALFRWPHGWLDSTVYGVFRREQLLGVRFPEWTYRSRPHIFCWEMDVLTELSGSGRIVALPECLRSYRLASASVGKQIGESVSSFDLLVLGLRMKLILLRRALRQPAGRLERVMLLGTVAGNLFRANFRQPYDHRTVLHQREKELALLRQTAADRAELITYLKGEIAARQDIVISKGFAGPETNAPEAGEDAGLRLPEGLGSPAAGPPNPLAGFFQPLDAQQVRRLYELNEQIGKLRLLCERQAARIETLSSEAERWLRLMHGGGRQPRK